MRRVLVVLLVAVVASGAATALHRSRSSASAARAAEARAEYGRAGEANELLLEGLPRLDGVRFANFTEIAGPPGGVGRQWRIWYATDDEQVARTAVERHAATLASWRDVHLKDGRAVVARDGDRFVSVAAEQFGTARQWGVSVTLDALDGELYPTQR